MAEGIRLNRADPAADSTSLERRHRTVRKTKGPIKAYLNERFTVLGAPMDRERKHELFITMVKRLLRKDTEPSPIQPGWHDFDRHRKP